MDKNNTKEEQSYVFSEVENLAYVFEEDVPKAHVLEYERYTYVIEDEEFVEKQTAIFKKIRERRKNKKVAA